MTDGVMMCANHPTRETTLRCNRCDRPICSSCAIRTPVGYRCPECVRGQQKIFDTALRRDYLIAAVISAVGMGIGLGLLGFLGFFGILLAPILGGGVAEVVRWGVSRRRSRRLPLLAVVGGSLGAVPYVVFPLAGMAFSLLAGGSLQYVGGVAFSLLWPLLHAGLALSSLYYRLRGIRLGS